MKLGDRVAVGAGGNAWPLELRATFQNHYGIVRARAPTAQTGSPGQQSRDSVCAICGDAFKANDE